MNTSVSAIALQTSGSPVRGDDRQWALHEPLFGLEEIRRTIVRCSKSAFYGPGGLARELPTIQVSARRKAVRRSDLNAALAARTSPPKALAANGDRSAV
jgi:hypothetical protein